VKNEACTAGTKHVIASFAPAPLKGGGEYCGLLCAVHIKMIAPHRLKELFNIVSNYVTTCTLKPSIFPQVVRSGHIIAHYVNIAIAIRGAPLYYWCSIAEPYIRYDGKTDLERSEFGRASKTGGVWQIPIQILSFAKRQDLKPWI